MYKQPIILFGIVIPVLLLLAVVGGCFFLKSEMTDSFAVKTSQFREYSMSRNMAMETENKISKRRNSLVRWKKDLAVETRTALSSNLKAITDKLPSKEFQETGFDPLNTRTGFASATQQKSFQFRFGCRGTYHTTQKALLELEARMPQLQLQELKMSPSDQSSLLNFQITYTAWEN